MQANASRGRKPDVSRAQVLNGSVAIADLLSQARAGETEMLRRLAELVRVESPSHDKAAVDQAGALVAAWAQKLGGAVQRYRHPRHGDSLLIRFSPLAASARRLCPVLLLGHLDTVWPVGTLQSMPWRMTRERIAGPGVLDMKAGVCMMLEAVRLAQENDGLKQPVWLLVHGDEEIGSPTSRSVTETVARRCRAVFVLEPAQGPGGAYKTARKGVGQYRLHISGVAAHSGVDFARGHSAVLELARQLALVAEFTDERRGITVNPGVIGGGTLSNVIAAEAWAEIDVRVAQSRDAARIDRQLRRLRAVDRACRITITGGLNRPPMVRTRATVTLFRRAQSLAAELGLGLEEAATGGGSDGNFTAALGIPTLDGMGAVGSGAHALEEHVVREQIAPRIALLAAMLQQI